MRAFFVDSQTAAPSQRTQTLFVSSLEVSIGLLLPLTSIKRPRDNCQRKSMSSPTHPAASFPNACPAYRFNPHKTMLAARSSVSEPSSVALSPRCDLVFRNAICVTEISHDLEFTCVTSTNLSPAQLHLFQSLR